MRIVMFISLVCIMQSFALESYTQNSKISLSVKEMKLEEILMRIENQTKYRFAYNKTEIDVDKSYSVDVNNAEIKEFLSKLFSEGDVHYNIIDRQIVLSPSSSKELSVATQQKPISGKITNFSGAPLPGVTVVIKGTTSGTITDADGKFTISKVPSDAIFQFSFVGMKTQEVIVTGKTSINITMQEENVGLDEVVAVGYGSVKKANLTTSISSLKQESIENRPITSISEAFSGQLAGVRAQQKDGVPGGNLNILIRGTNSINSGISPLYIIDGLPTTSLEGINPNNIESVEILKDASAAAIYGARGAGGVILIKSKSGKLKKPTISFNAYYGIQEREKIIDVMNRDEYIEWSTWARNEGWVTSGGKISDPNSIRSADYVIPSSWSDPKSVPDINWQEEVFHRAPMQNYQLSASGGNEIGTYLISGNYARQDGILKESNYEMFSFQSNTQLNISSKVHVGLNVAPSFSTVNDPSANGKEKVPHEVTFIWPTLGLDTGTEKLGYSEGSTFVNPLAILEETISLSQKSRILSSLYLEADLTKNLHFKTSFGYDRRENRYTSFSSNNINMGKGAKGGESNATYSSYVFENTLNYNKTFHENHHIDALLGVSVEKFDYAYSDAEATGYTSDDIFTLNTATTPTIATSSRSENSLASFFGRAQYDYKEKYLISSTLRYDGCSRFGSSNRWGLFPSVSLGWKVSSEDFMKEIRWINLLKIRMAWGEAGNNSIGDYGAIGSMSSSKYSLNNKIIGGYVPGTIDNPNLGWETTITNTIGVDMSLWNNRIQLSLDGYINDTKDLLLNVPVPTTTGFASLLKNIGKVRNQGWELELNAYTIKKQNFSWNTSFNLSYNKNEVKKLGKDDAPITVTSNGFATNITKVGEAIGSFYLFESDGLLKSLDDPHLSGQLIGNIKVVDQNKDGKITDDDRKVVGKANPDYVWGIQNSFQYKNLDFSCLLQGQWGADIFFYIARGTDHGSPAKNKRSRWTNCYRSADQPGDGVTPYPYGNNAYYNDTWLYNASFIRLKNINLGYSFSKSVINAIGVDKLRLYFSVENAFTLNDYPGVNPEANSYGNDTTSPGLDYGTYPLARKFIFGVNLTF